MKKWVEKILGCDKKGIAWVILTVFVISLMPLLYLSGYVYASGDDYGYGTWTHVAWLSTHSVWKTLIAAAQTSIRYWDSWQGTWFTIFLMALQPEVFSPAGYWVVPWLMLGINILVTSLLTRYFMVKKLGLSKAVWGCVNFLLLFSMIQFFPRTKSAIFWWNGAVHYIVPYCLGLLAVYTFFRYADTAKKRYVMGAGICCFCLGGSSYLAPLFALIVLGYLLICEGKKKRYLFWLLIPAGIEMAGLLVSFLSPGNKSRGGEDFGFHWTLVVETILECFRRGAMEIVSYVQKYPLVFVCLLLSALFILEGFMEQRRKFRFPYPLLFIGAMFCLYCAMFAPEIYAGVEVSGGVPNTYFQIFLLTFLAGMVYVLGWCSNRMKEKGRWKNTLQIRKAFLPLFCLGLVLLFMQKGTLKDATAYECYEYISSGQADDYKMQMEERMAILLDPAQREVELPAMNPEQGPLMHMEVMEDPAAWTNKVAQEFFQKDRVVQVKRK